VYDNYDNVHEHKMPDRENGFQYRAKEPGLTKGEYGQLFHVFMVQQADGVIKPV